MYRKCTNVMLVLCERELEIQSSSIVKLNAFFARTEN